MQRFLMIACSALILVACNSAGEKTDETTKDTTTNSTAMQNNDGFTPMFDGKTTAGWHKYGGGPVGSSWKIDSTDGSIYLDTTAKNDWQVKNGGDIVSDEEYDNFILSLEWKIAKDGNSGIMFYINEDSVKYKYPWHTGPEVQVLDNAGHADSKIVKHRAGDLYDLISCSKETVKPAGEWNQVEIKAQNGKLDISLNGENVISTTMWDDNWKKLIAGSKFKSMPDFGTYKKGRIGLQDHGNTVWFRNVKIKKL